MANVIYLDSNMEIFIPKGKDDYHVLRPVSKDKLKYLRSLERCMEDFRSVWENVVATHQTIDGLEDYCNELLMECSGDEDFPLKDDEYTDILEHDACNSRNKPIYGTLRDWVDSHLREHHDFLVGTWEYSGSYPPESKKRLVKFYYL